MRQELSLRRRKGKTGKKGEEGGDEIGFKKADMGSDVWMTRQTHADVGMLTRRSSKDRGI